jgi:hypothetical protein
LSPVRVFFARNAPLPQMQAMTGSVSKQTPIPPQT